MKIFPFFFEFVHPDKEIITAKENSPIIKVSIPITLGMKKSLATTFFTYPPGVVIIEICIIANTATRKHPAESVADFKILFVSLSFLSETNKLATTEMDYLARSKLVKEKETAEKTFGFFAVIQ